MEFITETPTTIFGWVGLIFMVITGGLYLVSRVRKNDMEVLRSANTDLRASLDDNIREIAEMRGEINTLISKVSDLEKRNKTLEDLVVVALKQYFFENPTLAKDIQKSVV